MGHRFFFYLFPFFVKHTVKRRRLLPKLWRPPNINIWTRVCRFPDHNFAIVPIAWSCCFYQFISFWFFKFARRIRVDAKLQMKGVNRNISIDSRSYMKLFWLTYSIVIRKTFKKTAAITMDFSTLNRDVFFFFSSRTFLVIPIFVRLAKLFLSSIHFVLRQNLRWYGLLYFIRLCSTYFLFSSIIFEGCIE